MSQSETTTPSGPVGLLLCRDLIFTSKITGTARALGHGFQTAGTIALASAILAKASPAVIFADLAAGDLTAPAAISAYRAIAPSVPILAFGSHVETEALEAARQAGCDPVLPRSRFSADLPGLIARYFVEE